MERKREVDLHSQCRHILMPIQLRNLLPSHRIMDRRHIKCSDKRGNGEPDGIESDIATGTYPGWVGVINETFVDYQIEKLSPSSEPECELSWILHARVQRAVLI
jgi:hypothetical protein